VADVSQRGPLIHYTKSTWANLQFITEDLEVALCDAAGTPSGVIVRRDPRLLSVGYVPSETWVPRAVLRRTSSGAMVWTLRTAWNYRTFDPLNPPAGWTTGTSGTGGAVSGGGAGEVVVSSAGGGAGGFMLTYILGAQGTTGKVCVVCKCAGLTSSASDYAITKYTLNQLGAGHAKSTFATSQYRYIAYTAAIYPALLPAIATKQTYFELFTKPITTQNASTVSIPSYNTALCDARADGLSAWSAGSGNDLVQFWVRNYGAPQAFMYIDHCAIYTQ
jgi:hypothetical protein